MIVPPAEILEQTADVLPAVPKAVLADQLKELQSFGEERAKTVGATGLTPDFEAGYQFGVQVARQMLANSAALVLAKVEPSQVL
jgi:hypothetical protein